MKKMVKKILKRIFSRKILINRDLRELLTNSTLKDIKKKILEEEKKTKEIDNKLRLKIKKLKKYRDFRSVI